MEITVTKSELANRYKISSDKLRKLMNVVFLDDLKQVGYDINSVLLSPKVIEKFIECYGAPIDHLNKSEL